MRGVAFVYAFFFGYCFERCRFLVDLLIIHPIPFEDLLRTFGEPSPAVSEVVFEHAFIVQSISVGFLPAATALIVFELAPIDSPRGESEHALAVSLPIHELSVVVVALGPVVVSLAVG